MGAKLLDGPAAGESLLLRRAPEFLRVVIDQAGKVDALDQLSDTPEPGETIHVYRIVPDTWRAWHQRASNPGTSGFFQGGEYRHVPDAPADDVLRYTDSWRAWCMRQPGAPAE